MVAKVALEDVRCAVEMLQDPLTALPGSSGAGRGLGGGEVVKVLELMLWKAESARRGGVPTHAGVKRKLDELEGTGSGIGWKGRFSLPFVGSGVCVGEGTTADVGWREDGRERKVSITGLGSGDGEKSAFGAEGSRRTGSVAASGGAAERNKKGREREKERERDIRRRLGLGGRA
ncbi:hypothetical protein M422DRAFT_253742 [Sphaerobolus stellatus SS14]|uniref:Uncharacterized protein n=1 Tax=Sphaerobolus stellatus (strain SS14) TaxID=990650 RepID=A0A0C9VX54_SPHS4|nr:hypothetical protein M422DRAFT_253742 [Sphaerobolus stellatus SS14]